MKNLAKSLIHTLIFGLLVLFLSSCGGGDDKGILPTDPATDPPADPKPSIPLTGTVVSGVVMLGPVINADVNVYELTIDKSKNPIVVNATTLLGTSTQATNDKGEYAVAIKPTADNTPILVCATAGTYTEPASKSSAIPVEKTFQSKAQLCPNDLLCDEEKLCAVAIIKRDEKLKVSLTYFSHLAYGLASNRIIKGATLLDVTRNNTDGSTSLVLGGISNANKIVSDWLQLRPSGSPNQGVISITPQDITNSSNFVAGNTTLTEEIKYGLANATISELVEWMRLTSATNQTEAAFSKVSSIGLAQLIFKDIIADGDLDGLENAAPLFLSDTAIKGHMLRYHFAFKLFIVASNPVINQTGLNNADIDSFVKALNKNGVLFSSTAQVNIVNDKPVFSHTYPNDNGVVRGDVSIKIDATDINDVSSISMTMDTVPPGGNLALPTNVFTVNPEKPEWAITTVSEVTPTTPGIPDGIYEITFVATNTKGVSTTRKLPNIRISNKNIHSHIINPPEVTNTVGPKNPINSLSGFAANVNDVFFDENTTNSSVNFSIVSTAPNSAAAPIPVPLLNPAFTTLSTISRRYFASDLSAAIPDGTYKLVLNATSGKNVTPVLTAIPSEVEFEFDTQIPSAGFDTPDFFVFTDQATINLAVADQLKDGNMSGIKTTTLSHDTIGGGEVLATVINNQSVINFTEQGWHKFTLNTMDYAGNTAMTKYLNVAYDTNPPLIQISNVSDITMKWQSILNITAQVDDVESGIFEIFSGLNISANTGNNLYTGDITEAPKVKTRFSINDKDLQVNNNGQLIPDGIYKYSVRASDYSNLITHTKTSDVLNIGIDSTPPLITFTQEEILQTPFSATPVWIDVTANKPAISFNPANTIATINWLFSATVEEQGYIDHSTPTTIAGLSSGVARVSVDGQTQTVLSADAAKYRIKTKNVKSIMVSNLPQYTIESTASVVEVWNVIATCPTQTAGGVIGLDTATGTMCVEVVATKEQPRATIYNWIQVSSMVDTNLPAPIDVVIPDSIATVSQNPIVITAMDKSSIPNTTGLSGNQSKSFACLNFRVSNVTTLALPVRSPDLIITDSGVSAKLPTAGINNQDPSLAPIVCTEATTNTPPWNNTPLIPALDSTLAFATYPATTAITCTIKASNKGITNPAATTSVYKVEMQLSPQISVDPAATSPLVCPAVI